MFIFCLDTKNEPKKIKSRQPARASTITCRLSFPALGVDFTDY